MTSIYQEISWFCDDFFKKYEKKIDVTLWCGINAMLLSRFNPLITLLLLIFAGT